MPRRSILLVVLAAFVAMSNVAFAQGPKKCQLQKVVEWQVRSLGRHMAVDGAINGKRIGVVLHTGSPTSALLRASAKRLDIPIGQYRGSQGLGDDARIDVAFVDEFKLGDVAVGGMRFYVAGNFDPGEGFDLQLGEDFLRNFDIEFDLAANAVRLWQPKDCAAASLAYWAKDVVGEAPINTPVPGNRSGYIELTVKLNDQPVAARLDSGASVSLVSDKVATTARARRERTASQVTGSRGKVATVWSGRFATFAIGNEDIPDVDIAVVEQDYPMLLGADFLRAHRTLVSHSQQKLYFTYTGGPVFVVPGEKHPIASTGDPPKSEDAARVTVDER